MSFEERLLVELKTHLLERPGTEAGTEAGTASPRRRGIGRRAVAGAALLGAAAVAAVAVPLVTGTQTSAYALTRNADGTIRVQINELRDPGRLEADLRAQGVTADIAYLPEGKKCAADPDPAPGEQLGRLNATNDGRPGSGEHGKVTHSNEAETGVGSMARESFGGGDATPAVEPTSTNVFVISPASLKPGHTVVLRFTEKGDKTSYTLGWRVTEGPVTPCSVVAG